MVMQETVNTAKFSGEQLQWSNGEHADLWYPSSRVQTWPKPLDFSGQKNPQHAFLRRGSKAVGPMSQICCVYKNPTVTVEVAIGG
jgi:hypothetical protein